jgi:transposase InsO family protein
MRQLVAWLTPSGAALPPVRVLAPPHHAAGSASSLATGRVTIARTVSSDTPSSAARSHRLSYRAPRENATCERFLGSVRRECLDHLLVLGERHLRRTLREYAAYFNRARPYQGPGQALPEALPAEAGGRAGPVRAEPVLGGLQHTYECAA